MPLLGTWSGLPSVAMATPLPSSHLLPDSVPHLAFSNNATLKIAHNSAAAAAAPPALPKLLTLVIVNQAGQVLLGLKKRGFGEGYYNGFGGKVECGETIEQAAVRELQEEAGITPEKIMKQGILTFHFDDKPQPWEVHVFNASHFEGKPCETEEMSPKWFSHSDIPFGPSSQELQKLACRGGGAS